MSSKSIVKMVDVDSVFRQEMCENELFQIITSLNDDDCSFLLHNHHIFYDKEAIAEDLENLLDVLLKTKRYNKTAKYIINKKLDKHSNETSSLIMASLGGNSEIVKLLIERGDNVNFQDYYGQTSLMYVAGSFHNNETFKTIKYLINAGANPNLKCCYGWTALMCLVSNDKTYLPFDIFKYLIDAGTNLDLQNCAGWTVSLLLSSRLSDNNCLSLNYMKCLNYLVDCGANLNIKNIYKDNILRIIGCYYRQEFIYYVKFNYFMKHYLIREKGCGKMNRAFGVWHIMYLSFLFCKL